MRRRIGIFGAYLLVALLAVVVYLALLPINISAEDGGLVITFPPLIRAEGGSLRFPDPINWNYLFVLPISLIILAIGFEVVHLFRRR